MTTAPWTIQRQCVMLDPVTAKPVSGDKIMNSEGWSVAEIYGADYADLKVMEKSAELLHVLKSIVKEIDLSKLKIRKDFHLINAHASASKLIHQIETQR